MKWTKKSFKSPFFTVSLLIVLFAMSGCSVLKGKEPSAPFASDDLPEIIFAYREDQPSPDLPEVEQEINRMVSQKLGARIRLLPVQKDNYYQQIQLMMLKKQAIDLFVTTNSSINNSMITKGHVLPLNHLLQEYAPDLLNSIKPEILSILKVNGELYSIPNIRDWAAGDGIVMRKDLLDKYHFRLDELRTLDDLEIIFQTIRTKEIGIYPLVPLHNPSIYYGMRRWSYDGLGDRVGVLPDFIHSLKVVNLFETKQYEEDIRRINRWYNAGYIPKDAAVSTDNGRELVKTGTGFAYFSSIKPGVEEQESRLTGMPMVAVPLTDPVMTSETIKVFGMSLAAHSEHPDIAMKFINLLYSDASLLNLLNYGIEGKHYIKVKDQSIAYPAGKNINNVGYWFSNYEVGNQFLTYIWESYKPDIWEQTALYNQEAKPSKALGFSFNADPVRTEMSAIQAVLNQYLDGLETGTLDPDETLPEFRAALRTAGIDRVIKEKQKQLDIWSAQQIKTKP
ncbi:ABC transporter substrate-binding protein [Paenibacillus sp. BR2-3]|uniref:ABC transporter substrate-binding protein n=1 Tax=Paenibacillus sp. BR2-3 TaxID=3048494 RepID=UPI00397759AD